MTILKTVKILTIIPCLFILISFFHSSFTDDKNNQSIKVVSLDQEFIQYVPETKLTICDGLGDTCKKFYIGFYLSKTEFNTLLALTYLLAAYESGIENILINEPEARDIYLTMTIGSLYFRKNDLDNAIKYTLRSIKAGNGINRCYLGMLYDDQGQYKQAYEAVIKSHYPECYTLLGIYAFNGIYIKEDKELAGKYWKKAYNDNRYGSIENANMALYYEQTNDNKKYKFHLLKAAKTGDSDALIALTNSRLNGVSTTKLFIEESMGSQYWVVSTRKQRVFTSGYDFYYRMKYMFNHEKYRPWIRDYDYREKIWEEKNQNIEKFVRDKSTFIFEEKKIVFESTLTQKNRDKVFAKELQLFYEIWLVDLSGGKDVIKLHHELVGRLVENNSFKYHRNFILYGYSFVWSATYNNITNKLYVEIRIPDKS